MTVIRSIKKMQAVSRQLAAKGKTIGLVPTMGFLHDGHLALIRRAKKSADVVITTIFVNPTQFAAGEDLGAYPRNEKADLEKIESAGGEFVFIPTANDIYPDDFQTFVSVEKLSQSLEGKTRPTHFRGVTTIVAKLYNITRPDVVIFGMKDFQQAAVLKQMTSDLGYPIQFVIAPTVREKGGLAMSSRNSYFDSAQRKEAGGLYLALKTARGMVRDGISGVGRIESKMRKVIMTACPSAQIDYIEFNDITTLEATRQVRRGTVCSLAVSMHKVRLIDNMKLL